MTVYFIGAGPGAPDLITIRGRDLVARCPVCLYAGSLVAEAVTQYAPANARIVNTASLNLEQIVNEFEEAETRCVDVARLHSGDPSIYSAIGEQIVALEGRGIGFEIVPGVPAFAAAAASLRRELTLPEVAQSVILTRISTRSSPMPEGENLKALGQSGATLALHLAVKALPRIVDELMPIYGATCPVAVVARATWPDELVLHGTLDNIAEQVEMSGVARTAIIFIGRVLDTKPQSKSRLYDQTHDRYLKPAG